MNYIEVKGDLFTNKDAEVFVHCISADAKMGAGIAKIFRQEHPLMARYILMQQPKIGDAVLYKDVQNNRLIANLITKQRFFHKPTYATLEQSLISLKDELIKMDVTSVAMPKIGSGLDRLDWSHNKEIIKDVFKDTNINVKVYSLD